MNCKQVVDEFHCLESDFGFGEAATYSTDRLALIPI